MVSISTTLSLLAEKHIAQVLLPYHPFLALPNKQTKRFKNTGQHIFKKNAYQRFPPCSLLDYTGKQL